MPLDASASQAHAFLQAQRLTATPANYQLAWLHVTGSCPGLTAAISRSVDGGVRLRQDEADELLAAHVGSTRAVQTPAAAKPPEALGPEIRSALLHIAQIASETGRASEEFGQELKSRLEDIGRDPAGVTTVVLSMIERASAAERRLAAVRGKVDELRQELETVKGDATTDALTGLPNRRAIQDRLARTKGPRSIAICDIDRFKLINDTFGHGVGDRVLKMVATTIAEVCAGHFVARWGGEEFLVVVEGDADDAAAIVDRARRAVADKTPRTRDTDKPLGRITFSAGVSDHPDDATALDQADRRLYAAKRAGRNQVALAA